jgi:hypothetical protein
MPIVRNSKKRTVVFRATANETFTVASTVVGDETVVGLGITEVYWTGDWTVKRGANTLLVLNAGQDNWDFTGWGSLIEWYDADIVLEQGAVLGTIIIGCSKYNDQQNEI